MHIDDNEDGGRGMVVYGEHFSFSSSARRRGISLRHVLGGYEAMIICL